MRSRIRAGDLSTPMMVGKPTITVDATGAETIAWTETKVMALVEPLTGREWAQAALLKETVDVRMTIRHIPSLIPSARWRMRDPATGTVYNIVTVMPDPRNALVEMMARSQAGNLDGR